MVDLKTPCSIAREASSISTTLASAQAEQLVGSARYHSQLAALYGIQEYVTGYELFWITMELGKR